MPPACWAPTSRHPPSAMMRRSISPPPLFQIESRRIWYLTVVNRPPAELLMAISQRGYVLLETLWTLVDVMPSKRPTRFRLRSVPPAVVAFSGLLANTTRSPATAVVVVASVSVPAVLEMAVMVEMPEKEASEERMATRSPTRNRSPTPRYEAVTPSGEVAAPRPLTEYMSSMLTTSLDEDVTTACVPVEKP